MTAIGSGLVVLGFIGYFLSAIAGLVLLAFGAFTAFGDFNEGLRIVGLAFLVGAGGSIVARLTIFAGVSLPS